MRQDFSRYRCALIFKIGPQAIRQRETVVKPIWLMAMAAVMTIFSGNFYEVSGQVQERSRWLLPDVAMVTLDSSGQSQIDFNPAICRRLGPELCEYFRAHEYGHVNLRHLERGVPTRQAEREADIWAATNASPSAVEAARKYFAKGRGGSLYHGSAHARAQRLSKVQTSQKSVVSVQKRVTVLKPSIRSTVNAASATKRNHTQYSSGSRTTVTRQPTKYRTNGDTANATARKTRAPTQYSGGSRITVTRQPTKYRTNGGTANVTARKTRAPTQYSGGSRKTVVRKAIPNRTKRVVKVDRPTSNTSRSYYSQGYVPKGGFNNRGR